MMLDVVYFEKTGSNEVVWVFPIELLLGVRAVTGGFMNFFKVVIGLTLLCSALLGAFGQSPALESLGFIGFMAAATMAGIQFLVLLMKRIGGCSQKDAKNSAILDKIGEDPNFADVTKIVQLDKQYAKHQDSEKAYVPREYSQRHFLTPIDLLSDFVLVGLVCWLTGWTAWWQIIFVLVAVLGFVPPKWSFGIVLAIFAALFLGVAPIPAA
jgi:hypothetical protein